MPTPHDQLKQRQRAERDTHPEGLALRVHRALSWLDRAGRCDDDDGRFVFLWIAFNSAYSAETGEQRPPESEVYRDFLRRLDELDADKRLSQLVWEQFSGPIRVLLDNHYIYQPFWNHHNAIPGYEQWQNHFDKAREAARRALANHDTVTVLGIAFSRLYTLRNQIVHGGATWASQVNRDQLRDAVRILEAVVPAIIEIMLDHPDADWGEACYPVVNPR